MWIFTFCIFYESGTLNVWSEITVQLILIKSLRLISVNRDRKQFL